jgi:hypothetical protein
MSTNSQRKENFLLPRERPFLNLSLQMSERVYPHMRCAQNSGETTDGLHMLFAGQRQKPHTHVTLIATLHDLEARKQARGS